jgi:hypothetical protein
VQSEVDSQHDAHEPHAERTQKARRVDQDEISMGVRFHFPCF